MREWERKIFSRKLLFGFAISSLAFLIVAAIPLFGSIGFIFTPLPILYYYSKLGRIQGLAVLGVSLIVLVIVSGLGGVKANISLFFLSGSLGPILSEALRKGCSIEKTVLHSVWALLTLTLVLLICYSVIIGKTPWHLIEMYISESIQENIRLYSQFDVRSEQINLIKDNAKQITTVITNLFPALFLISLSFVVWLNILTGKLIFKKNGMWYPDFGDLACWKFPDRMVWIIIISGGLLLIPVWVFQVVGLNLLIVFLFIYMFQGLAIVTFFFKKKKVPGFLRVICYFLIFAQQFLLLLVIGLGLFDVWIDFRKFNKKIDNSTA